MHQVGDYVKLLIPRVDILAYDTHRRIARYNEKIARVNEVHTFKGGVYYYLEGVVARSGIPYSIPEEWTHAN